MQHCLLFDFPTGGWAFLAWVWIWWGAVCFSLEPCLFSLPLLISRDSLTFRYGNPALIYFHTPFQVWANIALLFAHNAFFQFHKIGLWKRLGQDVSYLVLSGNWEQDDLSLFHMLPEVPVIGVYVLGSWPNSGQSSYSQAPALSSKTLHFIAAWLLVMFTPCTCISSNRLIMGITVHGWTWVVVWVGT